MPRLINHRRTAVALCGAVAVLLAGCGAQPAKTATATAPVATGPATSGPRPPAASGPGHPVATTSSVPAAGPRLRIGLSYSSDILESLSAGQLGTEFDDAVTLGAQWVRFDLPWAEVQPTDASTFEWTAFDRLVQAARSRGLSVLPIIDSTPGWARPAGCASSWCGPAQPSQFAAFAAVAAQRYGPQGVHTWEIWNEPNLNIFWKPAANPAAYVNLLRLTVPAIRAADPSAFVISGGLAPAPDSGGSVAQLTFLAAFARLGGPALVNAIGYHPFSAPVPPGYVAPWNAWQQIADTAVSFRSILVAAGHGSEEIWLTEYGASTNGPGAVATTDDYDIRHQADHVDEAYQAVLATDSLLAALRTPALGALFWYSDRDEGTSRTTLENFFGLRRFDGTFKPAFAALQAAIATASHS